MVNSSQRKAIARWFKQSDEILISALLDHLRNGDKVNGAFTPEIWTQVTALVNKWYRSARIPSLIEDQVKKRYGSLRKNLNDFVDLLKTAGVRWDIKNGKILAPDEVWAQYLKSHDRAGVFKTRPLHFFEELCELFDTDGQTIMATCVLEDEETDDEDDVMEEDHDLSAVNDGASQFIYQDSPIRNDNGAPVSNFLAIRSAATPALCPSPVVSARAGPQGNDGHSTAISGAGKNDPNGRDLTEIPKIPIAQIHELIAAAKSIQGIKTETMPVEYSLFIKAVGKAARLYHTGEIYKEDFRLAVSSLKQDVEKCIAFCEMSDELRIDWLMEGEKEGGGCTSNTKA